VAVPREDPDVLVGDVKLDAVAVELDLVNPAVAARDLLDGEARAGSTKPGNGALIPMAAGFLRWNAMLRPGAD
jgi:hypothetical protein